MDLTKVLEQLHEELRNLNSAIASLERLQETGSQREGNAELMEKVRAGLPLEAKRKARPNKDSPKKD